MTDVQTRPQPTVVRAARSPGPARSGRRRETARTSRPVLVEIMIEREADTADGVSIDAVAEYEPVPEFETFPESAA